MQGKHLKVMIAVAALLPAPALAGQHPKKPPCQITKAPSRDAKKVEPCRKNAPIPWVIDPTPLFLASTGAPAATVSKLS